MVNSELLNKIADQIEAHPESLNMETWVSEVNYANPLDCGTVACIAGWAIIFSAKEFPDTINLSTWHYEIIEDLFGDDYLSITAAEMLLGLDQHTGYILFFRDEEGYTVNFPTLLRELAKGNSIKDYIDEKYEE